MLAEVGMLLKILQNSWQPLPRHIAKNYLVQNVSRTKTEKLAVVCRGIDEIITQMKFYLLTEIRAIMINTQ